MSLLILYQAVTLTAQDDPLSAANEAERSSTLRRSAHVSNLRFYTKVPHPRVSPTGFTTAPMFVKSAGFRVTNVQMKTTHKIAAARWMYRAVRAGRSLLGRSDRQIAIRNGIKYDLDLAQGIDFAIYLANIYERQTRATLRALVKPASLVLDIGANVGAHTLHLAHLVGPEGRVLAFEPTDFAYHKLIRNLKLNPGLQKRVIPFHCFLTGRDAGPVPAAVYSSWPLKNESDLHAKHLGREMGTGAAQARRLDDVLTQFPDLRVQLVKLDVDGYECDVLRGAPKLIKDVKPIFVMELAPYVLEERGTSLEELLSYFIPNGYRFFDDGRGKALPSSAAELRRMVSDGACINAIARAQ
ncbi:FkbM family methyltransferase [Bradyrhizobium sp. CW4]|uniref:FkbM family methyltransferase n=1 Tax=Bradyrhizobium sp. CW4 TaxID=2782687 RepID=UPI001FFBA324|nr:FkbM family methyltransferase [Bradyrhizobium sp. CW4]